MQRVASFEDVYKRRLAFFLYRFVYVSEYRAVKFGFAGNIYYSAVRRFSWGTVVYRINICILLLFTEGLQSLYPCNDRKSQEEKDTITI